MITKSWTLLSTHTGKQASKYKQKPTHFKAIILQLTCFLKKNKNKRKVT